MRATPNSHKWSATGVLRGGAICAAILMASVASPMAANATNGNEEVIAGFSRDDFIEAAATEGVSTDVASQAWGDLDAMSRIPIHSELTGGGKADSVTSEVGVLAAVANYSASCTYQRTNLFGGVLQHFKVNKAWQVNSTVNNVIPNGTSINAYGGYSWVYAGLVNSSDSYSGTSHSSYRMGLFDTSPSIEQENRWVRITGHKDGTYSCTNG